MTALKKKVQRGFTLVELLIVIALLAIIALIVIAAINPIEQRNRARDTGMRSDGAQLISAIDRFFTARADFPWVVQDTAYENDTPFGFETAADFHVGLCAENSGTPGVTDCTTGGLLITTDELKPEFAERNFIDAFTDDATDPVIDELMIGKSQGASQSTYVCYVPLSKSNRETACDNDEVYLLSTTDGTRGSIGTLDCTAESEDWSVYPFMYICIPE